MPDVGIGFDGGSGVCIVACSMYRRSADAVRTTENLQPVTPRCRRLNVRSKRQEFLEHMLESLIDSAAGGRVR